MPSAKKGCGCLVAAVLAVAGGCSALFGGHAAGRDPAADSTPAVALTTTVTAPPPTRTPRPVADLDGDGIADRYDRDADGDGVTKSRDRDDRDPGKGARAPRRTRTPEPRRTGTTSARTSEPRRTRTAAPRTRPKREQPAPVVAAHPGGFCGTPGAVGVASNGRTYVCRGGHWRR
ncbi:hypothetical protein ACI2LC_01780 [Nonomuraea wenchangensis]|uniref:hypothetical protein n=1 Tax=Nonomuraea wenchangensis TaxID=568860 RepID=UPI00378826E9